MNVRELKEQIVALPSEIDDCEVYVSSDGEGNAYHPLHMCDVANAQPVEGYRGELEFDEVDYPIDNQVLIIYPI